MRRDRELLASLEQSGAAIGADGSPAADDRPLPVLRLYSWRPWCVSIGHLQDPEAVLDLKALNAAGLDWVKRPTGGRAVFHAEEITYSLVAYTDGSFARGLGATHRRIGQALQRFYTALQLKARLTRPSPPAGNGPGSSAPCFVSPGLAELEIDGRKVAGSAQRRGRHAFLQHGSLLTGNAHLDLVNWLPLDEERREASGRVLATRSASLSDLLDRLPPVEHLQELMAAAFAAEFGISWVS
jgi:lipoate-protein ligase A